MKSFWYTVREDAAAQFLNWQGLRTIIWSALFLPTFSCIFWYRVNRFLFLKGHKRLSGWLKARRIRWFGNDISPEADIGDGMQIGHLCGIVVGKGVRFGRNARLQQGITIGTKHFSAHPNIPETSPVLDVPTFGDNVAIGANAIVVGRISVGDNVKIGALSFIDRDIPSNSVAYGTPPNLTIKPSNHTSVR